MPRRPGVMSSAQHGATAEQVQEGAKGGCLGEDITGGKKGARLQKCSMRRVLRPLWFLKQNSLQVKEWRRDA